MKCQKGKYMLMIIEKDWIVLTYIVLPQCCIYTCIRTTTYTSMQKSHLALTGYHLVCSVYDNIHIGVAQNTCARLMSVLPFTTSHGRCWVLGPFSSDFLFCCAFENRLQVEWFFFFFLVAAFSCSSFFLDEGALPYDTVEVHLL